MTYPTIAVKVSFTTGRYDTPSYTTLPAADVRGLSIESGKKTELDGSNPADISVDLFSDTRTYDPNNASSTYSPNLKPGKKVQITATYGGTTYELANGWTTGWPNKYGLRTGTATLKAAGAFAFLQRATIPDAYSAAVMADTPTGYYRLGDAEAHTIIDSSGNARHGRWYPEYNDIDTADSLPVSDDKAVKLPGSPDFAVGKIPSSVVPLLRPFSVEMWVAIDKQPDALAEALYAGNQVFSTLLLGGGINVRIYGKTGTYPGAVDVVLTDSSNPSTWHSAECRTTWIVGFGVGGSGKVDICNGQPTHLVFTINSAGNAMAIYVNGTNLGIYQSFSGTLNAIAPWESLLTLNWAAGWDGDCVLDELAFYSAQLSSTQVATHYAAGISPGLNDHTGDRVGRVLDLIDWPASLRDLDTGQTVLGVTKGMAGTKALDYLDKVAATEQALLTEAHHDGGKVRFQDRAARLTDSRSSTAQTTFADDAAALFFGTAVPYSDIDLASDDRPAANSVTIKWAGTDVTAVDQASIDAYGEITATVDTLLETHEAATNLAEWILAEQASLFTRVRSITLRPNAMSGGQQDRTWAAALARQEGDRVRVIYQPASTGTAIDQQLIVIGVEHHASNGVEDWETTLYFAPAITTAYWILDTSALGTNTRLAY